MDRQQSAAGNRARDHAPAAELHNAYLDVLETERDALIMRLRSVDAVLVRFGRLKAETLTRRVR